MPPVLNFYWPAVTQGHASEVSSAAGRGRGKLRSVPKLVGPALRAACELTGRKGGVVSPGLPPAEAEVERVQPGVAAAV